MSHKPIWYIKQIPPELCDMAVADFLTLPSEDAAMGDNGQVKDYSHRNTTIRFAPSGHWFSYILHGVAKEGNFASGWLYDIAGYENIQFAEYGPEQHYNWHVDVFPMSHKDFDRKVSVICLLSDPSEFEGGEFEVKLYQEYKAPLKKGSVIAFPSILEHRVTPVISGLRRSATVWLNGPKFR